MLLPELPGEGRLEIAEETEGVGGEDGNDAGSAALGITPRGGVLPHRGDSGPVCSLRGIFSLMITFIAVSLNKEYHHELRHLLIHQELVLLPRRHRRHPHPRHTHRGHTQEPPQGLLRQYLLPHAGKAPLSLEYLRSTQLHTCIKTIPKGVLHNVVLDCCDDLPFVPTPPYSTGM